MASPGVAALQEALGYSFLTPDLLCNALTHSSACMNKPSLTSNERLEFMGDRVLGLVVAHRLYELYPDDSEGSLAYRYNALVNRLSCAQVARALSLGDFIIMSEAERRMGGADKEAILADACEALIAAVYLDGGFSAARELVDRLWIPLYETLGDVKRDPKSRLQEQAQKRGLALPVYKIAERTGPDHAPHFVIVVTVTGIGEARGSGGSRRVAEQTAAQALLDDIAT
ncbi:MAG: ribonuclease III [Parvularculales bacterium]